MLYLQSDSGQKRNQAAHFHSNVLLFTWRQSTEDTFIFHYLTRLFVFSIVLTTELVSRQGPCAQVREEQLFHQQGFTTLPLLPPWSSSWNYSERRLESGSDKLINGTICKATQSQLISPLLCIPSYLMMAHCPGSTMRLNDSIMTLQNQNLYIRCLNWIPISYKMTRAKLKGESFINSRGLKTRIIFSYSSDLKVQGN